MWLSIRTSFQTNGAYSAQNQPCHICLPGEVHAETWKVLSRQPLFSLIEAKHDSCRLSRNNMSRQIWQELLQRSNTVCCQFLIGILPGRAIVSSRLQPSIFFGIFTSHNLDMRIVTTKQRRILSVLWICGVMPFSLSYIINIPSPEDTLIPLPFSLWFTINIPSPKTH